MTGCLLRLLGWAIVPVDRLLELELIEHLHARHVADTIAMRATIGNAADVANHIRQLTLNLRQVHAVCALQHEQNTRLRQMVMVLEEQNEMLLADSGEHLADEIGRTLEGGA